MKAKKHTGPMRALLVALSVVSMLLTGLFVANTTQAGAEPIDCPDGFQLTEDEKSCYDHPVMVTTQAPVDCEVGHLTPDKSSCYAEASEISQAPTSQDEIIDASVVANASDVRCPTGYTLKSATSMCSATVATPDSVVGQIVPNPVTTYSCPGGGVSSGAGSAKTCSTANAPTTTPGVYVAGTAAIAAVAPVGPSCAANYTLNTEGGVTKCFHQLSGMATACPAAAGVSAANAIFHADGTAKGYCTAAVIAGTPGSAAVAAVSATCNGAATTLPASSCSTTVNNAPTVVAATPSTSQGVAYCPVGTTSKGNGQCSTMNADRAVEIPATVTANSPTVTCPNGYEGPTANNQCTRSILTAQPNVPVCEAGTLLDIGNGFVCLLDNKPVAPAPESKPSCPKGEYDAKADLCLVPATTGSHPGSVAVGPKAAGSASTSAIAPAFTG